MADGSIRIETKLDNTALKQQIKELEKELNNIRKEQAKVDAQVDATMAKYEAEKEFDAQFPEEFSHRQEIDERAAKELDPIIAKQEELNQKEQEYLDKLTAANAKLAEQSRLASASKEVDKDVASTAAVDNIQSQAQYNSLLDATAAKMARIEAAAARVAAQTGLSKDKILATNPAYQKLSDTMGMLKAKAADFGNAAQNAGKKASKAMKSVAKDTTAVGTATKKGIATFGKMQLVMMGIMMATRAISAATQEYIAVNSELEGQINTLKALWGQVLGPVIEWFIGLIIRAVTAVNALVEALSGINFIARANEAALKKQASAAGAASKAQLAGFDEQNKLNDTSGGGGSAVTELESALDNLPEWLVRVREELEKGNWYGAGKSLTESLMQAVEDYDWSNLGNIIGYGLTGVGEFLLGAIINIDPLEILNATTEFVSGFFNGAAEAIRQMNWGEIGRDIVDLLIKGLIAGFILTNPIAQIMYLLFTPEGQDLSGSIINLLNSLLSALTEAVTGASGRLLEIGLLITAGLLSANPVDMLLDLIFNPANEQLTEGAFELIGSILGSLAAAVLSLANTVTEIGMSIWNGIKGFFDSIDWDSTPEDIIDGLFEGIKEALKTVGQWVYDHVWTPFVDAFCKAAGIDEKGSEKMKNFGKNLIDGLVDGIEGAIDKVKQACVDIWEAIKEKFANVGTWFKDKFTDAWNKVKEVFSTGGQIFSGIKEGISDTFKTIVNKLIDGINTIIRVPFNKINSMLNTIRGIEVLGISPFSGMWSYNPLSIPQIPKLAVGGIVNRPGKGVPAIIGEAGAEAVLPLENNTEWMDILAEKIGGNVTIPIYMDGKKIATYVVDIQKKKAFAMNGV